MVDYVLRKAGIPYEVLHIGEEATLGYGELNETTLEYDGLMGATVRGRKRARSSKKTNTLGMYQRGELHSELTFSFPTKQNMRLFDYTYPFIVRIHGVFFTKKGCNLV